MDPVIRYLNEFGVACLKDDFAKCKPGVSFESFAEGWIALAIRRGYWAYFGDESRARLECSAALRMA